MMPEFLHMPSFFVDGGNTFLLYCVRSSESSFWDPAYAPVLNGILDHSQSSLIANPMFPQTNRCCPQAYREAGKLSMVFIAGGGEGRFAPYRAYKLTGDSLQSFTASNVERVSPLGLRPWSICENEQFRVVAGALDSESRAHLHVLNHQTGEVFALRQNFSWIYRVSLDAVYNGRLLVCGQLGGNEIDEVVTLAYDLSEMKMIGALIVDGCGGYKASLLGDQYVAYAVRIGNEFEDRQIVISSSFDFVPVSSDVFTIDGVLVSQELQELESESADLSHRCHWKLVDHWYCTKLKSTMSESDCLLCPWFDSSKPCGEEIKEVNDAFSEAIHTTGVLQRPVYDGVVATGGIVDMNRWIFKSSL